MLLWNEKNKSAYNIGRCIIRFVQYAFKHRLLIMHSNNADTILLSVIKYIQHRVCLHSFTMANITGAIVRQTFKREIEKQIETEREKETESKLVRIEDSRRRKTLEKI